MNLLSFLDLTSEIGNKNADCVGIASIVYYGVYVVRVIQIVVPIALIIWGSIDLLKSIISGDEKKIAAARKPFIQRLISALIVFLLPWIVNMVIGFASDDGNARWRKCWKDAWNKGKGDGGFDVDIWGDDDQSESDEQ